MKYPSQQFPLLGYTTFDHGDDFFVFCKCKILLELNKLKPIVQTIVPMRIAKMMTVLVEIELDTAATELPILYSSGILEHIVSTSVFTGTVLNPR